MDESDTEDSDTKGKRRAKKKIGKSKTKEEQKLIDFFNQMDDDGKTCIKHCNLRYLCNSLSPFFFAPFPLRAWKWSYKNEVYR